MQALPPDKQTDLRAYWLIQHGQELDRAILSTPAGLSDLFAVLAASRGIDPAKAVEKRQQQQDDVMRRIAQHSGVPLSKVKGSVG